MIVRRFSGLCSYTVPAVLSPSALPGGLVIPPGVYAWQGVNYDCMQQGLYRFWNPLGESLQRVVFLNDVCALMSSLAWICVNGRSEETLTVTEKTTRALTSKLRMLCGKTVEWVSAILSSLSIQNRTVRILTAATPTGYYDGHVAIEVKIGGVWTLFDPTNGAVFRATQDGALLSLRGLFDQGFVIERNDADGYAEEPYAAGSFDVTMWQELTMRVPADFDAELRRLYQIPGIVHTDGLTYCYMPPGTESRQSWVQSLGYQVVSKATWDSMFYA